MKNFEIINFKKQVIAFVVREKYKTSKTTFFSKEKNSLQLGHIVKKRGNVIPRHKHKKVKRIIFGTPEILIVKKGQTNLKLFKSGRLVRSLLLKKNDIVSLIDCEHSFTFSKDTILHEIKQGPYIKNEKIIYD